MLRLFVLVFSAVTLSGQDRTLRLLDRLSQEAAAFHNVAPFVLGQETLRQQARKPPPKVRIRIGKSATKPPEAEWQRRTIVSDYAYAAFEPNGPLHELRRVISVDRRAVKSSSNSPEALARIILADDRERKKALVEQFAAHGLRGAATDFGQLILLFTPDGILRYNFTFDRTTSLNGISVDVFAFQQIDGPNPLTVIGANSVDALRIVGQVWVTSASYTPVRIVLRSNSGEGASEVQHEATVDYAVSAFAALLPTETHHRETHNGQLTAQNDFTYSNFKRIGTASGIVIGEEGGSK